MKLDQLGLNVNYNSIICGQVPKICQRMAYLLLIKVELCLHITFTHGEERKHSYEYVIIEKFLLL